MYLKIHSVFIKLYNIRLEPVTDGGVDLHLREEVVGCADDPSMQTCKFPLSSILMVRSTTDSQIESGFPNPSISTNSCTFLSSSNSAGSSLCLWIALLEPMQTEYLKHRSHLKMVPPIHANAQDPQVTPKCNCFSTNKAVLIRLTDFTTSLKPVLADIGDVGSSPLDLLIL